MQGFDGAIDIYISFEFIFTKNRYHYYLLIEIYIYPIEKDSRMISIELIDGSEVKQRNDRSLSWLYTIESNFPLCMIPNNWVLLAVKFGFDALMLCTIYMYNISIHSVWYTVLIAEHPWHHQLNMISPCNYCIEIISISILWVDGSLISISMYCHLANCMHGVSSIPKWGCWMSDWLVCCPLSSWEDRRCTVFGWSAIYYQVEGIGYLVGLLCTIKVRG